MHYFDTGYDHGLAWYQGHFPLRARAAAVTPGHRRDAADLRVQPVLHVPPAGGGADRRDLPGVKLLVLVRDPVERAYSAHAHELARGFETEPFERALELEDQRLAGEAEKIIADPGYHSHSHQHHAYRARGRYADQLERLAQLVGRDRVHVVDCGLFFTDPERAYDHVLDVPGPAEPRLPALRAAQRPPPLADARVPAGRASATTSPRMTRG